MVDQRLIPIPAGAVLSIVVGVVLAVIGLAVVLGVSPRRHRTRLVAAIVLGIGADAVAAGVAVIGFALFRPG